MKRLLWDAPYEWGYRLGYRLGLWLCRCPIDNAADDRKM